MAQRPPQKAVPAMTKRKFAELMNLVECAWAEIHGEVDYDRGYYHIWLECVGSPGGNVTLQYTRPYRRDINRAFKVDLNRYRTWLAKLMEGRG